MGLRRGFKTEATGLAKEIRGELGLGPFDRLDPHELARHLEIPVLALSELEESAPTVSTTSSQPSPRPSRQSRSSEATTEPWYTTIPTPDRARTAT